MTTRRSILAGLVLPAALTACHPALPVAHPRFAADHLDADLIAAGAAIQQAEATHFAAHVAASNALRAARADHGLAPVDLIANREERELFSRWHVSLPGEPPYSYTQRRSSEPENYQHLDYAWSARGLRYVLDRAVARLGPAGRTPFLLRRWRQLLPLAQAYDLCVESASAWHRVRELRQAERDAEKERHAARTRLCSLRASTIEGLAVQVRLFEGTSKDRLPDNWLALIESAAKVSGVSLNFYESNGGVA